MTIICKITLVVPIFLIFFLYSTTSINAQEVEDEREFEYDEKSKKGPKYWGEIKQEWGACKEGRRDHMQSPIDITKRSAIEVNHDPKAGELVINYKPAQAAIKNRGHDISLQWLGDAGSVRINNTDYSLKQCHWHSPSEHTINGRRYDLELHMVHTSRDQKIVVLGLLYKIGEPDSFLSKMNKTISAVADTKNSKNIGKIDPTDIHVEGSKYYRYIGSLTVPPCTEGVIWSINEELATVSREQIKILRDAVHDYAATNARPIQSLNRHNLQFHNRRTT